MKRIISIKTRQRKPFIPTFEKLSFHGQPNHPLISEPLSKEVLQSVWRNLWQNAGRPHLHGGTDYERGEDGWLICLSDGILQGEETGQYKKSGEKYSMEITLSAFGQNVSGLFALYYGYRSVGKSVEVPCERSPWLCDYDTLHTAVIDLLILHREAGMAHLDREMLSPFHPDTYQAAFAKREKEVLQGQVPAAGGTSKRYRL